MWPDFARDGSCNIQEHFMDTKGDFENKPKNAVQQSCGFVLLL